MRLRSVVTAALLGLAAAGAFAQAKEQFFPLLSYRTGPYAPNGTPWANGKQDYLKMINARDGGINGVKITYEECETGYATDRGVECYERLKGKGPTGAAYFAPLSTGITFALTEKAPGAQALDAAEQDELPHRLAQARQRRADEEDRDADHEDRLAAVEIGLERDRLADAQRIGPRGSRLDQIDELVPLIEAVDHGRGILGLRCDEIDPRGEIGGAIVASNPHLIADRKLGQLGFRHEEADFHVARRHELPSPCVA